MGELLDKLGEIALLAGEQGLTKDFFEAAKEHIEPITGILHITPLQAALFALLLENSGGWAVSSADITKALKCGNIQLLKYLDEFEALEEKHIIRSIRENGRETGLPSYAIPLDVIRAVRAGKEYRFTAYNDLSAAEFFETANGLLESCREREITPQALYAELKTLCTANRNLVFVKSVKAESLCFNSVILLFIFCCALTEDDTISFCVENIRPFFRGPGNRSAIREFKKGDHELFEKGFVEKEYDGGMANTERCRLTDKSRNELLSGLDLSEKTKHRSRNVIPVNRLEEKRLFYSDKITFRIDELTLLLHENNFLAVKKRLTEKNMRTGFTCLFSGPPGTGKTETVYQIARSTGRDIMLVDISETKSMWFGESEKKIKAVFDRYKGLIKKTGPAPILLFNEADGILGKRRNLGENRNGPGQTENAIQNIILQEMEDFAGGVLIATTNLSVNLDKAFERRFLYKIEFEKPDLKTKSAIWLDRMSGLSPADAEKLANRFDFSGGQIENIARKETVSAALSGSPLSLDNIIALCEDESLEKEAARIGFCV
ncbi:hypothetical protein FACS1894141_0960 [Spirochaetia bacterium]|nr:hypothetical protein FACS1894141_0960 [Spirochaetia bacterium]